MGRIKKAAAIRACQTKTETMTAIKDLGDAQRKLARIETRINDQIAVITEAEKDGIEALRARIEELQSGIQFWCEANRAALTADGSKTANLITGEVSWRQRPPSVSVRQADKVLEYLRAFGLDAFIRTKEEVNKEAVLANPAAVSGIPGLTVATGVEDFSVMPFEVEVTQ